MIAVLDYGIGNLRSAEKALQKVDGNARLVTKPEDAEGAAGVVLPGVGAFGACMTALQTSGLDSVVYDAVEREVPFLGVCVGLQLLYESSEETPGISGLGVLKGEVKRMSGSEKLPQMQWNRLAVRRSSPLLSGLENDAWCYFVHSFSAPNDNNVVATCEYGEEVVAVVEQGRLWATQFHPEKSSASGLRLLKNFVQETQK